MKACIFLLVLLVTFHQSAFADPRNCSVNLGYKVSVDFTVNIEAAQLSTPATGLLVNCRVEPFDDSDISELRDFLNSPLSRDLREENDVIKRKISENVSLSNDEKEFYKLATTYIEKARRLVTGDRLLICSHLGYPVEVTWGKGIKTLDMFDNNRELLASYEANCSEPIKDQAPKK